VEPKVRGHALVVNEWTDKQGGGDNLWGRIGKWDVSFLDRTGMWEDNLPKLTRKKGEKEEEKRKEMKQRKQK
jgi:hypothetical protein